MGIDFGTGLVTVADFILTLSPGQKNSLVIRVF